MGRGWKRAQLAPRQFLTRQTALDELKTHLRGAQVVLRSKTPDLVKQEFYGFLLAHFAVRGLDARGRPKSGRRPRSALVSARRAGDTAQTTRVWRYSPLGRKPAFI